MYGNCRLVGNRPRIGVAGETEDEVRDLVAEAIRLYPEQERGENAAAESMVVNHYAIAG